MRSNIQHIFSLGTSQWDYFTRLHCICDCSLEGSSVGTCFWWVVVVEYMLFLCWKNWKQHRIQRPGRGARNMTSMWPPLVAIFFMTCLHRAGGAWSPRHPPPGSATGKHGVFIFNYFTEHGNSDFVSIVILLGNKLKVIGEFSCHFACVCTCPW